MRQPRILISPDFARPGTARRDRIYLNLEYQREIQRAGGFPLIASPFADLDELAEMADAWLITGGSDMAGEMFGQETHSAADLAHPHRIDNEMRLWEKFSDTDIPVLGICFGNQFLAVINGGTLHQHLPDILGHDNHTHGETTVTLTNESRLNELGLSGTFSVRCFHHQSVDKIPDGWSAAAISDDGIVESITENSDRWRFGVQWHPERTADTPQSRAIFESFVAAATRR